MEQQALGDHTVLMCHMLNKAVRILPLQTMPCTMQNKSGLEVQFTHDIIAKHLLACQIHKGSS